MDIGQHYFVMTNLHPSIWNWRSLLDCCIRRYQKLCNAYRNRAFLDRLKILSCSGYTWYV